MVSFSRIHYLLLLRWFTCPLYRLVVRLLQVSLRRFGSLGASGTNDDDTTRGPTGLEILQFNSLFGVVA